MSSVNPITEFLNAAERAKAHQVDTVPATLATADAEGRPSARIVLVRSIDERGFGFFTNYESQKGQELIANPFAALCFHWIALDEQIRVEGRAARMESEECDAYFNGRPRGSQLGAWASTQSRVLRAREDLSGRPDLDDATEVHDRHLLAHSFDNREIVTDEENRAPVLPEV